MSLILTIVGHDTLDNGEPARLALDRHGAVIGRSPQADWSLPDPRHHISSRHCEISYRDGRYLLTDHSTNGTYLNGASERLDRAHAIADGDRLAIGPYAVLARLGDAASAGDAGATALPGAPPANADAPPASGWDALPAADWGESSAAADWGESSAAADWAEPPAAADWAEPSAPSGWAEPDGAASRWRQPPPAPARAAGTWDLPAPIAHPSAWSSAPAAGGPTADDVWGRLARESEVDWSRGDFVSVPARDAPEPAPTTPAPDPAPVPDPAPRADDTDDWARFVRASGIPADRLARAPAEVLAAAGAVLRQLVGGLMLMIDARARAKAQLGVQATGLELDGNNPLKFVRSPERALLQLLDAPATGFMHAERAVEDAFQDLQAHQMATLAAMRGALEGTLARVSPAAIRASTRAPGRLARRWSLLHRARQWDAYERAFEGVVRGANEAFMDLFAKEFRLHYDRQIAAMKRRRDTAD
ncbi:type VI secretion system-associated FHA domain protein TagH [Sphingomonas sp. BK235]|uniref:type VI secretion system-associated FHA domain protein TagH n=1 Tax=Sphingomonas sp. BK235 TaxID=2512131 RepID=UPI001052CCF9|nr:type VI secretion system-associated FHA domain protein TagH [Sphingomonas sp. BK235]TCP33688.1 FHA domain protein [Sphingomonas sp. BK235]